MYWKRSKDRDNVNLKCMIELFSMHVLLYCVIHILQHFYNVWIKRIPNSIYGINGVLEEAESRLAIIVKYGFDH